MIYYDHTKEIFINILTALVGANTPNLTTDCKLILETDYINLSYFEEWYSDIYLLKNSYEYKRDIFLLNTETVKDVSIRNCFISEVSHLDDKCEIKINGDYYEIGSFPELKSLYRDKKIELILN